MAAVTPHVHTHSAAERFLYSGETGTVLGHKRLFIASLAVVTDRIRQRHLFSTKMGIFMAPLFMEGYRPALRTSVAVPFLKSAQVQASGLRPFFTVLQVA